MKIPGPLFGEQMCAPGWLRRLGGCERVADPGGRLFGESRCARRAEPVTRSMGCSGASLVIAPRTTGMNVLSPLAGIRTESLLAPGRGLHVHGEVAHRLLQAAEDRQGDVEDGDAAAGGALEGAAVGVAVDGEVGAELVDGAGEAGGAEEGEDLQRLAFQGL